VTGLSFFRDVSVTGHVLGLGLGSKPTQWEQALGDGYIDDVRKGRMRRDYGLVELSFLRIEGFWKCTEISIQVHRLSMHHEEIIPETLLRMHGAFQERVPFSDLRQSILESGVGIETIEDVARSRYRRYWIRESRTLIHVLDDRLNESGLPAPGDVWSISLSQDAEIRKAPLK
jgi:hypothetical protein